VFLEKGSYSRCSFSRSFKQRKYWTLWRTMVEFRWRCVCRTAILRKTRNKFLNYRISIAVNDRKTLITMLKKRFPIKNHSVSERAELGLSPHAFISISIFLTKSDFFEGGGGLNRTCSLPKLISDILLH
jgi:hypothetical protein